MKILILDSDRLLAESVQSYFEKKLEVERLDDYGVILEEYHHINLEAFDALILGIGSDDMRALDLLDYMCLVEIDRPVIMMGHDGSTELLSAAFARGAEDFIRVPFAMKELELRLAKALRKKLTKDEVALPNEFTYIYSERAIALHHSYIDLTDKQKQLLYMLMMHKNRLVTYEMIQEYLYGGRPFTHNAVATHVRDIRKKIRGIPIKAVKGLGYTLKLDSAFSGGIA